MMTLQSPPLPPPSATHHVDRYTRLKGLCKTFVDYIKKRGKVIVGNVAKDKTMVQDMLEFKQQLDAVAYGPWVKNELFINGIREAFEYFINQRHNKPAEMIAQFFDAKLRTGYKELTEEKLDEIFDRVMVLFRFINGKDVFEAFYKTHLARRLLLQKSASVDAERSILSKLKQECGNQFTGKLEGTKLSHRYLVKPRTLVVVLHHPLYEGRSNPPCRTVQWNLC